MPAKLPRVAVIGLGRFGMTLARTLGYTSESAFSNAFKRVTGRAPKFYRNDTRAMAVAAE